MPTRLTSSVLLAHAVPGDPGTPLEDRLRRSVAALTLPRRVLAVGDPDGLACLALLAGAPRAFLASVGGPDAARLGALCPGALVLALEGDVLRPGGWLPPLLEGGRFDLVYLAGGGGRAEAQAGLEAAYWAAAPGGFILADGYDADRGVRAAVDDFIFSSCLPNLYLCAGRGSFLVNVVKK